MTERWRRRLGALDRVGPDRDALRDRALSGSRMHAPEPRRGRVAAAVVALAVAAGSLVLLRAALDGDRSGPGPATPPASTSPGRDTGSLDPAAICQVPPYEPGVALLGDAGSAVLGAAVEIPREVLDAPGAPASEVDGPAADALRSFLETPAAVNAPADGWRVIVGSDAELVYAAPWTGSDTRTWWATMFLLEGEGWAAKESELVDQRDTPAQRGHGLSLAWTGEVLVTGGAWNWPLELENRTDEPWVDEASHPLYFAQTHVYDPSTGAEVSATTPSTISYEPGRDLDPGRSRAVPVALGTSLGDLEPGRYDLVGCIPSLGLATPVGTLVVEDTAVVPDVHVLTYPFDGSGMDAFTSGELSVRDGCLAVGVESSFTYVLWPDGHALVERGGGQVLIDPVGTQVAAVGDEVSLGGGGIPRRAAEDAVIGGLPDTCTARGAGYFVTSGAVSPG